jgi:hypothetical protein
VAPVLTNISRERCDEVAPKLTDTWHPFRGCNQASNQTAGNSLAAVGENVVIRIVHASGRIRTCAGANRNETGYLESGKIALSDIEVFADALDGGPYCLVRRHVTELQNSRRPYLERINAC